MSKSLGAGLLLAACVVLAGLLAGGVIPSITAGLLFGLALAGLGVLSGGFTRRG
jgi:hypothetical protein